jgi:hypothetical protein
VAAALLALLGAVLYAADFDFHWRYVAAGLVAALALIPAVARPLSRGSERLRKPGRRARWGIAAVLFGASVYYFLLSASLAERDLYPKFHDEFMYLLQSQMLARGRLWMPQHPLAEFFDSFFVITRPVYAAAYFPGTALFYVPGVWLKLAPWLTSVVIAGLIVSILYLVLAEMLDGVAGILAAFLAVSLEQMRVVSVMAMSHTAVLLLVLLTVWAYLHWRRNRRIGWALAVGIFAGWAAITRPLDAVCLIVPVGIAMLWDLRGTGARRAGISLATVVLGALPFLSLQLIFDKGVTGHWLRTPVTMYGQANFPGLSLGFGPRTAATESLSPLPQVHDYYRDFLRDDLRGHGSEGFLRTWIVGRWKAALDVSLPVRLLLVLLPLGLLGVRTPARAAMVAGAALVPLAYTFWPTKFLEHYGLVCAAGTILLLLLAGEVLRRRFVNAGAAFALGIAVLAVASLPELRGAKDHFFHPIYLPAINDQLAHLEHTPAVVLFNYSGRTNVHEEPVYNIDAAWPDDAPVIRAQDRGADDVRIFDYYARREPARFFYRYDRATGELTPLGWAKDLAAKAPK